MSPNPVGETLNLRLVEKNQAQVKRVQIFDLNGRESYFSLVKGQANVWTISTTEFKAGFYFIAVLLDDGRTVNSKFVKN